MLLSGVNGDGWKARFSVLLLSQEKRPWAEQVRPRQKSPYQKGKAARVKVVKVARVPQQVRGTPGKGEL